jgi:hypothetical protein
MAEDVIAYGACQLADAVENLAANVFYNVKQSHDFLLLSYTVRVTALYL